MKKIPLVQQSSISLRKNEQCIRKHRKLVLYPVWNRYSYPEQDKLGPHQEIDGRERMETNQQL